MKISLESLQKFLKELFIIYVLFLILSAFGFALLFFLLTGTQFHTTSAYDSVIGKNINNGYFLTGLLILSLVSLYFEKICYLLRKPIKKIKDFFSFIPVKIFSVSLMGFILTITLTAQTIHRETSQKDIEGTCEKVVIDIWEEYKEDLVDSKIPYGYLKDFCRQSAIEFFSNFEERSGVTTAKNFSSIDKKELDVEHAFKFGTLQPLIENNILTTSEICKKFQKENDSHVFYPHFKETCSSILR